MVEYKWESTSLPAYKLTDILRPNSFFPDDEDISLRVLKAMWIIDDLEKLNRSFNAKLVVTSAYRPPKHELSKGRSGLSEHCFVGRGAVDVTCLDCKSLFNSIGRNSTNFLRVAYYPKKDFIHLDYKNPGRGKPFCKFVDDGSGWFRKDRWE